MWDLFPRSFRLCENREGDPRHSLYSDSWLDCNPDRVFVNLKLKNSSVPVSGSFFRSEVNDRRR